MKQLPESHLASIRVMEAAYLKHNDPIRQSGFGGGPKRWQVERSPLLDAVTGDGDFLDLGCANGYLLECVVEWGAQHGIELTPYGLDLNPRIIQAALRRFPNFAHHFWIANAWEWNPPRRFRWIYAIWDLVQLDLLPELARQLLCNAVTDDGALIFGTYGSRSSGRKPTDIARVLRAGGLHISGESMGGKMPQGGPVTRFVWCRKSDQSVN